VAGERGRKQEVQVQSPGKGGRRLPAIVLVIAFLVPLLNVIPTIDGYLKASSPDRVFLGFRFMAGDHFQYGSLVRQAADEGRFFMENRYTTEPQRPSYIFLYFWLVGMLCRFTGLSLPAMWEVLRVVIGGGFLIGAWFFTKLYFASERERLLAYVLIAFSGGIGWLTALLPPGALARPGLPGVTDPFNYQWNWSTFGTMATPFWLIPSGLLLVAGILLTKDPPISRAAGWAIGLVVPLLIWFVHPHTGNAAYVTFGLYMLAPAVGALWRIEAVPWGKLRERAMSILPFILSFIVVVIYLRWAMQDDVFKENSRHSADWSAYYSIFLYPLSYGVVLGLALFGVRWCGRFAERPRHFLLAWLAATIPLSTNPYYAGVKYQYLVHLPLALFAAHGILELRRRSDRARTLTSGFGGVVLGGLLFLNAPLILLKDLPRTASETDIYASQAEIDAARFLDSQPEGSILCMSRSGNYLAWLSRKKVYEGHWLLTIDRANKDREVRAFFTPKVAPDLKRGFLRENNLRYVYLGTEEKKLGAVVDPSLGLENIYDKEGVTIYRVP